jgi:small basic protein (TIGR04137 family)
MSIDRSLKLKGALTRHRNVLSRVERIEKLKEEEKWQDGDSAFGLPKVAHRKSHAGKKEKAAPKEAAVGPEGEAAAAAAAPAAAEAPKAEPKAEKKADKKADKKSDRK